MNAIAVGQKLTKIAKKAVLTDKETLKEVIECLIKYLPIDTGKASCSQKDIHQIIVGAASQADTIENTAKKLKKSYTGKTIRNHLGKFENFKQLENQINQGLISKLPRRIKKRKHKLAIDLNLIPYYGKPTKQEEDYIYRGQPKNGTCSFYAYASVYIIANNKRLTIAVIGIKKSYTNVAIITYLLDKIQSLNLKIKRLYLDRGFYSSSVIRWLIALDIPFIMPAIRNGKTGGINQYLKGQKSYKTTHTMNKGKENQVTFPLWVICKYRKGKRGKFGVEYLAYVVYKVNISLNYIYQDYRKRFGIETSYRLKNICRIRTTTKNPIIRLLYVGISFLIVNIWIYILWSKISKPRRGSRLVYRSLFSLKQMLAFLSNVINQIYEVREIIYISTT
ncbi:MAG: ISH3 family transposase [Prochloraceae cyanobacterium]|nr:ISH3 family transposase [Prochloraceae cyanobacterium]